MLGLLGAVFIASVLGSMHCIGMCGPLALWASGAGRVDDAVAKSSSPVWFRQWFSRTGVGSRLTAYHLGRLMTYLLAGTFAGLIGAAVTAGGDWLGYQALAARTVGTAMIALGLIRLTQWAVPSWFVKQASSESPSDWTSIVSRWVASKRPWIAGLPLLARGFAAGALTTLLPCGWLYLFVLVAMATGSLIPALSVMFAFWLGTLPALTALVAGAFRLAPRLRPLLPIAGALLLLLTGLYTATGRAEADLSPLAQRAAALGAGDAETAKASLKSLSQEPLPCCVDNAE
ncbi:MAG: sulfite exporter TauE/SafE family protein [Planctomycetales bacterium]|nr:sulfite exporter TauE/SafE family protein [Planctomycetales bacterium]